VHSYGIVCHHVQAIIDPVLSGTKIGPVYSLIMIVIVVCEPLWDNSGTVVPALEIKPTTQSITHDDDPLPPRLLRAYSPALPDHGSLRTDEIALRLGDDDLGLPLVPTADEREVRVRAERVGIEGHDTLAPPATPVRGCV
jgi:hypothetical protein